VAHRFQSTTATWTGAYSRALQPRNLNPGVVFWEGTEYVHLWVPGHCYKLAFALTHPPKLLSVLHRIPSCLVATRTERASSYRVRAAQFSALVVSGQSVIPGMIHFLSFEVWAEPTCVRTVLLLSGTRLRAPVVDSGF